MAASPRSVARAYEIISELGRLWNPKLRDEDNEELVKREAAKQMWRLQKAVNKIVREGRKKVVKAKSKEEIYAAFKEGTDKMICLMDE